MKQAKKQNVLLQRTILCWGFGVAFCVCVCRAWKTLLVVSFALRDITQNPDGEVCTQPSRRAVFVKMLRLFPI
jgi:hypothetical protein